MNQHHSDVRRLRNTIAQHNHAARQGLTGLAQGIAHHRFITARMEQGADRLLRLIAQGKHAEVQAIMETPAWELASGHTKDEQTR